MDSTLELYQNELCFLEEENYRRGMEAIRDRAIARFTDHGLCPQCGGDFGMQDIYLEDLLALPPQPGERFFRYSGHPPGCDWLWQPCEVCNLCGIHLEPGFHELSLEDVDQIIGRFEEATMARITDVVEENGRYHFRVKGGDDFNDAITALKEAFHYTERTWDPDTKEWSVAATEESEEKLADIFENAEMVFLGMRSQLRLL